MEQEVSTRANQSSFNIDNFISILEAEKEKGATHLRFRVSADPMWPFQWIDTFKNLSQQEVKDLQIKQLEDKLNKLK